MYIKLSDETIIDYCDPRVIGFNSDDYDAEVNISAEELAPGGECAYKYSGGDLVALTADEKACHPKNKEKLLASLSRQSFEERRAILPDYKITNALQGVDDYPAAVVTSYKNTSNAFRNEYYRIKVLIDAATTEEGINLALLGVDFPTELLPA